eukprot:NODE_21596_length_745_cov_3.156958.p2 GENE.NODE_21596_length_745_cov_3.156958~~NODE_21596_length_745_cov_3.156958.p2  ORF type:complete len:73 (-),score=17.46 NODE_21596_length_745_cov_3.156958:478-696(-)
MPLVTIEVPAGAAPGTIITFTGPFGGACGAEVPPGYSPGQTFQCEIADQGPPPPHATHMKAGKKGKNKTTCC